MIDVASYVGMGGNLIGNAINMAAAAQTQRAMYGAYRKELAKQGIYQQQATELFDKNVQDTGYPASQTAMAQGATGREAGYGAVQNVPLTMTPTPESEQNLARDAAQYKQSGGTRAALGSYGDWQHGLAQNNFATDQGIRRISNFSGGELNRVYPYEMYNAEHSQDTMRFWGDLFSSGFGTQAMQTLGGGKGQSPAFNPYTAERGNVYNYNTQMYQNPTGVYDSANAYDFRTPSIEDQMNLNTAVA